jgi:hypothetical protein
MAEGVVGDGRSNVTSKKTTGERNTPAPRPVVKSLPTDHTNHLHALRVRSKVGWSPSSLVVVGLADFLDIVSTIDTLSTTIIETPRSNVFADLDLTVSYIRCIISIFMLRITPIIKSSIC